MPDSNTNVEAVSSVQDVFFIDLGFVTMAAGMLGPHYPAMAEAIRLRCDRLIEAAKVLVPME